MGTLGDLQSKYEDMDVEMQGLLTDRQTSC